MTNETISLSINTVIDQLNALSNHLSNEPTIIPPGPAPRAVYEGAVEIFRSAIPDEISNHSIEIPLPTWVNEEIQKWKDKANELQTSLNDLQGQLPGPPAIPPVDPLLPLQRIAQAINAAEQNLNQENLVIHSGSVDVNLTVDVGGVAGAAANIKFNIAPRPPQ